MKKVSGTIDGVLVSLNVPETGSEFEYSYIDGFGLVADNEGYVFNTRYPESVEIYNSSDPTCRLLLVLDVTKPENNTEQSSFYKKGVVLQYADCGVSLGTSFESLRYKTVIKLNKEFCIKNNLGNGSIVIVYEELLKDVPVNQS